MKPDSEKLAYRLVIIANPDSGIDTLALCNPEQSPPETTTRNPFHCHLAAVYVARSYVEMWRCQTTLEEHRSERPECEGKGPQDTFVSM